MVPPSRLLLLNSRLRNGYGEGLRISARSVVPSAFVSMISITFNPLSKVLFIHSSVYRVGAPPKVPLNSNSSLDVSNLEPKCGLTKKLTSGQQN